MAYSSLTEKSFYLKHLGIRANEELEEGEINFCETYADTIIESKLQKTWTGTPPDIIQQVSNMLASCKAWEFIHTGQTPLKSDYVTNLRKQAMDILDSIKSGDMGIKNQDGTWDEDYNGNKNAELKESSIEFLI